MRPRARHPAAHASRHTDTTRSEPLAVRPRAVRHPAAHASRHTDKGHGPCLLFLLVLLALLPVRLRLRHDVGRLGPGLPRLAEFGDPIRLRSGQVVLFGAIRFRSNNSHSPRNPCRTSLSSPTRIAALPSCSQYSGRSETRLGPSVAVLGFAPASE